MVLNWNSFWNDESDKVVPMNAESYPIMIAAEPATDARA